MTTIHDLAWWYWFLTAGFLGAGLFSWQAGTFLAMLIAGLWGPLQWVHLMLFAGITARMLFGYCLLGRILSLAPWNRWQPVSLSLVRRTFLSLQAAVPPCGEVFRRMSLERVQG